MADTKIERDATAKSAAEGVIDKTTGLSEEVLESVEAGQRVAIEAVRTFFGTVDEAIPRHGDGPARRQAVVDSALEMADRLVQSQHDFIRKVIHTAGKSL
jgi:hypothetical protein